MASKQSPTLEVATIQTEFHVDLTTVLAELIDDDQIEEGDNWSFVCGADQCLIIVRQRRALQRFEKHKAPEVKPDADAVET